MKLFVGTSGYSYKEWKGAFYPEDLPAKEMLRYYGERFRTVELNHTFYKMPDAASLVSRKDQVPKDFKFVVKAPQLITHIRRLKNAAELLKQFTEAAAALKNQLGPLLFQLPPNMKQDLQLLRDFHGLLPKKRRVAFEFRHESWLNDDLFNLLRKHDIALCIAEAEEGVEVPFESTASWGYLRLRRNDYTAAELKSWLKKVQQEKWEEAFVFFKHDDEGNAPRLATKFLELAK